MPHSKDGNKNKSTPNSRTTTGDAGLVYALKSYVRVMNGFGLSDTIPAPQVVKRGWSKTDEAATTQAFDNAGVARADASKPTEALLASIMQAHQFGFTAKPAQTHTQTQIASHYRQFLQRVEDDAEPAIAQQPKRMQTHLRQLHPLMRAPLAAALTELRDTHHIRLHISESYRPPEMQDALVRKQYSYAPNGYSMHGHHLALDVVPQDAQGKPIWNTQHPQWKTIMKVMQAHGLYSLGADRNWDYPHFEFPLKTKEALGYQKTPEGWAMIPPARIPEIMQQHYAGHLAEYQRAEKLILEVNPLQTPSLPSDATRIATPPKLMNFMAR